jgi:glutamine synthetase
MKKGLKAFVELVDQFSEAIDALDAAAANHEEDPLAHARHIKDEVRPAMAELRRLGDAIQLQVAANLWPMPTYPELLFLK